jgi:hypothetical protein
MPKFGLAKPGAKDLGSSDADIAFYNALTQKVLADEAEKKENQRKRSIAMGLPESSTEGTWDRKPHRQAPNRGLPCVS